MLKARIAPHGIEDSTKDELRIDCAMCSPVGMRILMSLDALNESFLTKLVDKSAFRQTGPAHRDAYVLPPRESRDRGTQAWILSAAAYGLVNADAKRQIIWNKKCFKLAPNEFHAYLSFLS